MTKFISKLNTVLSLVRLLNVVITFISVIVAFILCSPGLIITPTHILAALAASLTVAAGNVINDVFDVKADTVNKPDRPLPSGKISIMAAVYFYIVLFFISITAAIYVNRVAFVIVSLSNTLLFLYSFSLKKIPLLGNFIISFLTGFVFLYGGLITGNVIAAVIPAGFAFLINLSREGIKSIEDIPGDENTGVVTFPQKFGINFSKKLISAFLILLMLFTFVPYINGFYGIEYFIIVMLIVNPLLFYVIQSLIISNRHLNLNKLSLILKLNMIFGLTAIYFGR